MKNIAKQILVFTMMILGATGAWAQITPERQSDGSWRFTMPSGNRLLNVEWKAEAELAWQLGGQPVPQEGVSGYVGFEDHVTFPTLSNPYGLPVTYSSTNTNAATINPTTGVITFVGAGTTAIKAAFAGNNDYAPDTVSYTLTVEDSYTLTLAVNNSAMGAVSLVDTPDLVIPITTTAGTFKVIPGTNVNVTATPAEHHYMQKWNNEAALNSNVAVNTTFTVTKDTTLTAYFVHKPILTLKSNPSNGNAGHVDVDSVNHALPAGVVASNDTVYKYIVDYDTTVTVKAIPAPHYHLASWNNTGGNVPQQTFTMTKDSTIYGVFAIDTFTLTLKTNDINKGTVEVTNHQGNSAIASHDPDAYGTTTYKVNYGAEVIVKATPAAVHYLASWSNGVAVNNFTSDSQTLTITENTTLTANFAPYPTLTLDKTGEGTVTVEGAQRFIPLDTLTTDYIAQDGDILTGTLDADNHPVKISIADGITVTLHNASINGVDNDNYLWAGINCEGDATIVLSGTNTVKGFYRRYPGIHVPESKTLTIQGNGALTASNTIAEGSPISIGGGAGIGGGTGINCGNIVINGGNITTIIETLAAGIGGGADANCGNITITGGTINATGGSKAAGIGAGCQGSCGNINITGGIIHATGGSNNSNDTGGAGIGSGHQASCGNITITNSVTEVTATKGNGAINSIGRGSNYNTTLSTCDTVTIGGTIYWNGSAYVGNGSEAYLTQSPLIYTGNGTGSSTSNSDNIPVATVIDNGDGTYSVYPGTEVTVKATPAEHNHLASWTPAHTLNEQDTAHVIVNETMTLTANFVLSSYDVTASVVNTADMRGTVKIDYTNANNQAQTTEAAATVQATALSGSTTAVIAIPAAGYHFVNWTNGNAVLGTNDTLTTTEALTAIANFDTTHAELAWSAEEFTGYTRIDFNTWKPTLTNPHSVNVRYGCAEGTDFQNGGIEVDATTGVIGFDAPQFGHIAMFHGTYHIYAVHETDQNYYYDSVVYTLHVLPSALVGVSKNIPEGGSTFMPDATAEHSLKHFYAANAINGTDPPYVYMALDDSVRILAEPAVGYHFSHWKIPGKSNFVTTLAYTCHFIVPNSEEIDVIPLTVRAFFAPDTFTITYMDGETELNVDTFYYHQSITDYTASKEGWTFLGWNPEVPEVMPAGNLTVYAQWYRICDSVTDVDHNTYPSVNINNKCWMAANLRTTHYSDGRAIPNVYEYQSTLYPNVTENVNLAGRLYDWYAAMDVEKPTKAASIQGICPNEWRMPTAEDAALLNAVPATELRTTTGWVSPNYNTNSTGFSAYPAGFYNSTLGRFEGMGTETDWWMVNGASVYGTTSAGGTTSSIQIPYYCDTYLSVTRDPKDAISVRCVKD